MAAGELSGINESASRRLAMRKTIWIDEAANQLQQKGIREWKLIAETKKLIITRMQYCHRNSFGEEIGSRVDSLAFDQIEHFECGFDSRGGLI
jgi:hypothetical protein